MTSIKYRDITLITKDINKAINELYTLDTFDEGAVERIYQDIRDTLIETNVYSSDHIIDAIQIVAKYNTKYFRSYLRLFKRVLDEYHPKQPKEKSPVFMYFLYKEYNILAFDTKLEDIKNLETKNYVMDVHEKNTIFRAIMYDKKDSLLALTRRDKYDETLKLKSDFYPESENGYSLLELSCYHGSINCFRLLINKFKIPITRTCLNFSFLGRSSVIMHECVKKIIPDQDCMKHAIISHNDIFVKYLMNKYCIKINEDFCAKNNNLQALLLVIDQTNNIDQ
ncbi:hypothetical protein TVAG_456880 [Trichomonas vaginalis G3]|uniref:DUF3447 domain-containing protein n=1 Tax=Trichomonas vaginalis (strain ATCC PRA-98 / G3) TaxID=412133 RepID=A2DC12_TRIV3|nr:protein of unknown function (DUF3447) [Trichomonas vaginalis G3]EAY22053.1 hypothetical protein TVAG_456880 [Trichomonas vaginalis G3]KAI5525319.1 protein of unknown function (DUF3447) [Trichomonas vaginalis G3]|eukprot:XP_001583039.1 hypothetical protein [Trichomonas vaginalis G3]